jgi:transposase
MVCDRLGRPLTFFLSPGQMSDAKGALALLDALPPATMLLADKGYDADWFREALEENGISACIPARRGRKNPAGHDRKLYKQRHRIENLFARLKDWRRIATRYDRCGDLFLSAICIAADRHVLVVSPDPRVSTSDQSPFWSVSFPGGGDPLRTCSIPSIGSQAGKSRSWL